MKVVDVAKWFYKNNIQVNTGGLEGNIVIQKLCYYAQAMYLAVYDKPLFEEKILAWENGPVIEEVYQLYKYHNKDLRQEISDITAENEEILKVVNSIYGYKTPNELIESTHSEDPWKQYEDIAKDRNNNPEIDKEKIKDYYKDLKQIYELNKDNNFEDEKLVLINSCNFLYNTENIKDISMYIKKLKEFTRKNEKNKSYNVVLDNTGDLMIYD